ncbi:helix-turn-helix transcriptional regulator [Arthrobacter sp. UYEF6]|uniref:helix-turn-helix transcriptional regulator n=1 Tax=Pseudarthrobacter sp. S6 TaxID=3418420 RepID=UPI00339AEFA9
MTDSIADQLAREVRSRRLALGLTQKDVADMTGVSERFVRFIEQGKPSVQLDSLLAVLDTLGLELRITTKTGKGARALAGHASDREPKP